MKLTISVVLLTVTVQEAVLPPSSVVTVIVAVPALTPRTTPPVDTVATAVLLLLHVTFLFVALEGVIVTVRFSVPFTKRLVDVLFKDTPVTKTGRELTVIVQNAVLPPSTVVTIIVAVPTLTPVTTPPDTIATAVLLLFHDTFWFVALEGVIVTVRFSVPPTIRLVDVLFKDTPVTETGRELMVTVQEAVLLPSAVVTVIVAVPVLTPVTTPPVDTMATAVLLLLHVTFLFVALEGSILAKRVSVPFTARLVDVLLRDTPVTGTTFTLIVTVQVA